MATSSPPHPPQSLSAGGGGHISLFLDTDLGTHLALNVAADSSICGLKSQVAVEHAAAFPDLGTVSVKSFQVLRKGAMYHLSDSMVVRSAFAKVKAGYFLHVKMTAAETDTRYCRDEGRRKSSAKLPTILEGGEDAAVLVNVHAHDVHLPSSSKRNIERNSTQVSMATDVRTISVLAIDNSESYKQGKKHGDQTEGVYVNSTSVANINGLANQSNVTLVGKEVHAREEDLMHNVGDRELGFVSGDKQMGIREETLGELHALDDLSQEKGRKKARVTGSFDTSAVDPIRETYDSRTRDVETNTNSCEVLSNTSFQQEMDGNVKEDSVQLENPIITGKNKKRKKSILVTSKDVSARQMTGPSTGAVEVPKTIGDCASDIEMTSRDKTKAIPADMLLSSSPLNSVSQVTKHVQLGTDAQATSDLAADQSNIGLVHEGYRNLVVGDISISTCKVVAGEEKSAEGISDGDHDENAVDACKDFLETVDNISQEKNCKKSKKASSVGLTSMGTAEAKDQCRYSEKAGKSDIISTQQEIVNDPYKRQTASNLKQGDCKENPNDDVKRKKKRRHNTESSNDVPTQDVTKSSGFIMNASSTENTSTHCLDAKQITLGNIGEETADEKNQCRLENVVEPVIVSNQGADVNDPSNGAVIPEGSSDAVEPNDYVAVHPDNSKINFIDHFNPSATNGPSDSAKNNDDTIREVVKGKKKSKRKADTESQHAGSIEPNDLPASDVHTDKTRLADHFGTGNVGVPSVSAENMNREDGNVKKAKEKKKSKTKPDLLKPKSQNPNGGNQDTDNCTQDLMHSDAQTGRIEHDYANENTDKVIQNGSMLQQETENATRDSTLEKNPHLSMFGADSKTDLLIEKDHAHISKEQRSSTSQTKRHAKSTNNDVSIDGRTSINPNAVSNPVQSFPMSPQASNESAYGTPAANKFRVAVRKVPRKIYEQVKGKSKKDSKRGTGTIFDDTISESSDEVLNTMGEKAAMENSSSTSAGSGISSAAWDGGEVPDDDDIVSLSQKSDIHSILRGSRSYKKARLKPTEPLDDTEVPDSQPLF
uniref:Uncharacterized protein n=1 Tax=Avena sativa TaxID=4498 RepID=A0ACD5W0C2_AVESA